MNKRKTIIGASNLSVVANCISEPIIEDVNLDIKHGELVFITGNSGSGKTIFLKTMYGELPVCNGSLKVANLDLVNISKSKLQYLRRHIGLMFQDHQFIDDWSVEKNILLPLKILNKNLKEEEETVNRVLEEIGLDDKKTLSPLELSNLDKQKLSIARSIIHNPPIVLMDDPIGSLDDTSAEALWTLIESFHRRLKTTFIVFAYELPKNLNMNYKHFTIESGKLYEVN